jgi:hypothetical protein
MSLLLQIVLKKIKQIVTNSNFAQLSQKKISKNKKKDTNITMETLHKKCHQHIR